MMFLFKSPSRRFSHLAVVMGLLWACFVAWGCEGECRYDADCPEKKICRQGTCTSNLVNKLCQSNADCIPPKECIAQQCITPQCQGTTQEPCFEGPPESNGIGLCQGGIRACSNGRWTPCSGQILPSSEVCDNLDNDCNGQIDDSPDCNSSCQDGQTRPCYTGSPTTREKGICRAGTETCQGSKWGPCLGQVLPAQQEVCNDNLDNNCDGQVDEGCGPCQSGQTRSCYTGPANTRNVGTCKDGTETCQNGQWSLCVGDTKPQAETCDQLDNDCNGQVDDSPNCQGTCQPGQTRPCYTGPPGTKGIGTCKEGTETCQNGQWSACLGEMKPAGEKCGDNLDNNCNGQVDEGCGVCTDGAQEVCYSGQQGCSKNPDGTFSCNAPCKSGVRTCQNGQWTNCQGEQLPYPREVCNNGADDDCNGQIDDNCGVCTNGQTQACYTGPAGTKGVGECKEGTQTCQGNNWGACIGEVKPTSELCGDNKDNNCNGTADENCSTKLHQNCNQDSDCDPGQICLSAGSQGYCFQNCSSNASVCQSNSDGRTSCMLVASDAQGNQISICVKQSGANAACNPIQSIFCQNGYACIGGTCQPVTTSFEGQECDGQSSPPKVCDAGLVCVGFGTGYPAICLKQCNGTCSAGFRCLSLQSGGGACIRENCTSDAQCTYPNHQCVPDSQLQTNICAPKALTGPIGYAGVCDPNVASRRCQSGLFCLQIQGATTGMCSLVCTSSCPFASPGTSQCIQINAQGQRACIVTCTSSCPSGLRCQDIGGAFMCFP